MAQNQKKADRNNKEKMESNGPFHCYMDYYKHKPLHYHPHWHDFLELVLVRKRYLRTTLRNTNLTIKEGELLVVMPGELHSFDFDGDGVLEYTLLQIDSGILRNVFFDSGELSKIYPCLFSAWAPRFFLCGQEEIKNARILPMINNLFQEIQKKELAYSLCVQASLLEIFAWLLRRWNLDAQMTPETGNFSIGKRMQPVLELLTEQYREKININEMAQKMNMSVPYFCRLFKKMTGCSFHNYMQSLRIVEAIKLLFSTDENITQIASLVGFNDVNFFIRVFKKQAGMSPLQYRKNIHSSYKNSTN